jgi:hypothetical protein
MMELEVSHIVVILLTTPLWKILQQIMEPTSDSALKAITAIRLTMQLAEKLNVP